MKTVVVALMLVAAVLAAPNKYKRIFTDYHEEIGIPEASRIKAAEEARDFDGSRIFGGEPSRLGQFPFMAGLLIHVADGRTSVCGSSLLTNTRLVTAAHCWRSQWLHASSYTVVLGSLLIFSGGTRKHTNRVEVHAGYDQDLLHNDIALITIDYVPFSDIIKPIHLPTVNSDFVGTIATAAGWGLKGNSMSIPRSQYLSHVNLRVITNAECMKTFNPRNIISSTLCTSGATGNICSSDSGGPLSVPGPVLIGVVSFGAWNCESGEPAGYARVTSFANWIRARL